MIGRGLDSWSLDISALALLVRQISRSKRLELIFCRWFVNCLVNLAKTRQFSRYVDFLLVVEEVM